MAHIGRSIAREQVAVLRRWTAYRYGDDPRPETIWKVADSGVLAPVLAGLGLVAWLGLILRSPYEPWESPPWYAGVYAAHPDLFSMSVEMMSIATLFGWAWKGRAAFMKLATALLATLVVDAAMISGAHLLEAFAVVWIADAVVRFLGGKPLELYLADLLP